MQWPAEKTWQSKAHRDRLSCVVPVRRERETVQSVAAFWRRIAVERPFRVMNAQNGCTTTTSGKRCFTGLACLCMPPPRSGTRKGSALRGMSHDCFGKHGNGDCGAVGARTRSSSHCSAAPCGGHVQRNGCNTEGKVVILDCTRSREMVQLPRPATMACRR